MIATSPSTAQGAPAPSYSEHPTYGKLLSLLAAGVVPSSAALAVGLVESEVLSLLNLPEFATALGTKKVARLETAISHDETLEAVESRALSILSQKLPFIRNASEAARIFQILNSSKKRTAPQEQVDLQAAGMQQVSIVLPKAARVHLTLNSSNQVIDVEGRSMATLPSRALPALSSERRTPSPAATLQQAEAQRASDVLEKVSPLQTVIGGVQRVL